MQFCSWITQINSSGLLEGKGPFPFLLPDAFLVLALALANASRAAAASTQHKTAQDGKRKSPKQTNKP